MEAGCIILAIFIIILAACIMPWWWLPVCAIVGIIAALLDPKKF